MQVTAGNLLVALTVISGVGGILVAVASYGKRFITLLDLVLRVISWYSKETGYPIPKEIADRYVKVNGNSAHPLPHDSGEHASATSMGIGIKGGRGDE